MMIMMTVITVSITIDNGRSGNSNSSCNSIVAVTVVLGHFEG